VEILLIKFLIVVCKFTQEISLFCVLLKVFALFSKCLLFLTISCRPVAFCAVTLTTLF